MNITLIKSIRQAYFTNDDIVDDTWDEIAEFLLEFHDVSCKENAPMFNMWQFKNAGPETEAGRQYEYNRVTKTSDKTKWTYVPNTIRRCKANVIGVWGLVLDYDNGMSIDDAIKSMSGIECVIYTTYNHTAVNNKFRVVIPFSRMMDADEFRSKEQSIRDTFMCVDESTFDMSRAFYMHSGPYPVTHRSKGVVLSPNDFKSITLSVSSSIPNLDNINLNRRYEIVTPELLDNKRAELLLALSSCSGVHYSSGLTLASMCKSVNCSFDDFQTVVNAIRSPDSGLSDPNWQNDLWVNAAPLITSANRDKFLVKHGSKALVSKSKDLLSTILAKKMMKNLGENK